jgi:hypothetical protein
MKKGRRNFLANFKTKVARAAVSGSQTLWLSFQRDTRFMLR